MLGDHPTSYLVVYASGQQKSLEKPGFSELFWVTRHSCPGDHAAKAKVSSLAAFAVIDLLDLQSSPTVLPSALAHHVETKYIPT